MVACALNRMDEGLSFSRESAIAKCYGSDIAMQVASDAIQLFGMDMDIVENTLLKNY